ncbi:MAG TPA: chemotaxis protein CheB [Cyclobacteriaceae bacterium]|nr:chemotaxis protein CheB [Cyclobacteriaceae bacterium]
MEEDKLMDESQKTIVIGGSAGSLSMVLRIVPLLRKNMNVSVLIVMHRMPSAEDNVLQEVLESRTSFEVREVEDKDLLKPGTIYVAPPDYHVLVEKDRTLTLDYSEKVNFSRPSIDVTFESAAEVCGTSLVCVLLSGANADGVTGLVKVKEKGGRVVIQDPASADFAFMPQKALEQVTADLLITENNVEMITGFL